MKKLFAMLLALCMMCGTGTMAGASGAMQTIETSRYVFDIPEEWTLVENDAYEDGVLEYTSAMFQLPDNSFREFEYESADGSYGFSSSYILWGADVAVNHWNGGNWIDVASGFRNVKEAYEYDNRIEGEYEYSERRLPDGSRVACGMTESQVEYLLCKDSLEASVLIYTGLPVSESDRDADIITNMIHEEIYTEIVLPIFESIRTHDGEQVVASSAPVETVEGKQSVHLANATFQLDADLVSSNYNENIYEGENDRYVLSLMCVDWNAMGVDINLTGDEQRDNAFYCSLLLYGDQDTAVTIVSLCLPADYNMPDGSDVMLLPTDGMLMLTHYYRDTGFLLLLQCKDEAYQQKLTEVAVEVALSFRLDGVTEEEMAADAEAARLAAEEAAAQAAAIPEIIGYIVITDGANIRTAPDGNATKIKTAYAGEVYPLLGEEGTWYKIEVDGQVAYVVKGLAKIK